MTFMTQDDRQKMRSYYDEFGDAEWERRVLEIGAGPGRFTMELIDLGAKVAVTDFSPVQLDLNRTRLASSTSVESWEVLDVCDTSHYSDGEFDAVVAYGGPLSYAFENVEEAVTGLFRIVRTGDLRHIGGAHVCQMFRASDITNLVERCGGEVRAMSASNWASLDKPEALSTLESDPDRWRRFLEHEIAACAEPGALDGGTHLLFAARSVLKN